MNTVSINNNMSNLEDLHLLDLSEKQIKILLEDNADIKSILHAAQECNHLRPLIRYLILNSCQNKSETVNAQDEKTHMDCSKRT